MKHPVISIALSAALCAGVAAHSGAGQESVTGTTGQSGTSTEGATPQANRAGPGDAAQQPSTASEMVGQAPRESDTAPIDNSQGAAPPSDNTGGATPDAAPSPSTGGAAADGSSAKTFDVKNNFRNICSFCHQDYGRKAGRGPQLMNSERSDEFLFSHIKIGVTGRMPGFGSSFNDDQIRQFVKFIRSLKPGQDPQNPA